MAFPSICFLVSVVLYTSSYVSCSALPSVDILDSPPAPCCLPEQWQGKMGTVEASTVDGQLQIQRVLYPLVAFDYNNGKFRVDYQHGSDRLGCIADSTTNSAYVINYTTKTCRSMAFQGTVAPHCLPEEAQFVEYRMYGIGNETMNTAVWTFYTYGPDPMTLVTGVGSCVPISAELTDFETMFQHSELWDMNTNVDPEMFVPPIYCNPSAFSRSRELGPLPLFADIARKLFIGSLRGYTG